MIALLLVCQVATMASCDQSNARAVIRTHDQHAAMWACLAGGMMTAAGNEVTRELAPGEAIKVVCRQ